MSSGSSNLVTSDEALAEALNNVAKYRAELEARQAELAAIQAQIGNIDELLYQRAPEKLPNFALRNSIS